MQNFFFFRKSRRPTQTRGARGGASPGDPDCSRVLKAWARRGGGGQGKPPKMRARLAAGRVFSRDLVGATVDIPRSDGSRTRGNLTGFVVAALDSDFKRPINLTTTTPTTAADRLAAAHWGAEAEWTTAGPGEAEGGGGAGGGGGRGRARERKTKLVRDSWKKTVALRALLATNPDLARRRRPWPLVTEYRDAAELVDAGVDGDLEAVMRKNKDVMVSSWGAAWQDAALRAAAASGQTNIEARLGQRSSPTGGVSASEGNGEEKKTPGELPTASSGLRPRTRVRVEAPPISQPRSSSSSSSSATSSALETAMSPRSLLKRWTLERCATATRGGADCGRDEWRDHPCCRTHYANAFAKLPAAIVGLTHSFLGPSASRAALGASRQLRATIEVGCSEQKCLANTSAALARSSPCAELCATRGRRLVTQAFADVPSSVAMDFRMALQNTSRVVLWYDGDTGASSVEITAGDLTDEQEEEHRAWVDAADWSVLHTRLSGEAADRVRDAFREPLRRAEANRAAEQKARRDAIKRGQRLPPRRQLIDVVGQLERLQARCLLGPESQLGRLMTDIARLRAIDVGPDDEEWNEVEHEATARANDAHRVAALLDAYETVAGHPYPLALPTPEIRPVTALPWVSRVLRSAFRTGRIGNNLDADAVWSLDEPRRIWFSYATSVTEFGGVVQRLLSEPPAVLDELYYSHIMPPPVVRGQDERRIVAQRDEAVRRFNKGVRMWRAADLLSGVFADTDADFQAEYPPPPERKGEATLDDENEGGGGGGGGEVGGGGGGGGGEG